MFNQIKDNSKELQERYKAIKDRQESQIKAEQEAQKQTQDLPKETIKKRGK